MADSLPTGPAPIPQMIHFSAQIDPVDFLPEAAASRLKSLRQARDDARALLSPGEVRDDLRAQKMANEARIAQLTRPRGEGGFNMDAAALQVSVEQRKLDKVVAELKRITELDEIRYGKFNTIGRLVQRVESWCRGEGRPGGTVIVTCETPAPPAPKKGESYATLIEAQRLRIAELHAQRHRTESAPVPSSVVKAKLRQHVQMLADRGKGSAAKAIKHDGELDWPQIDQRLAIISTAPDVYSYATGEMPDVAGLIAWLFPKELVAAWDRVIDTDSDDKNALDDKRRAEMLAQIGADLLATERLEIATIEAARAADVAVDYREDTDVRAALGVDLVADTRAQPTGTSPVHAIDIVDVG